MKSAPKSRLREGENVVCPQFQEGENVVCPLFLLVNDTIT
jgi:hypothetical protein